MPRLTDASLARDVLAWEDKTPLRLTPATVRRVLARLRLTLYRQGNADILWWIGHRHANWE